MNYACTLIAVVIGLGMAAVAAHESEAQAEPSELQQAHHSRDFAARRACVHCRIGSSEIAPRLVPQPEGVHCRIGSSENPSSKAAAGNPVHCRIGSSEI